MLYVRTTAAKGRSVFAQRLIRQGEVLERSPVLVLPASQWDSIERTVLFNYCYEWDGDYALALGLGSLFHHAYQPNALYTRQLADLVMEYTALRDIARDEEITINYNGDPTDQEPVWFAVAR